MFAGDAALVSKLNLYFFFLTLLIAFPIIAYVLLYGLNFVGFASTAGASTILPPLVNYSIYFLCFLIGSAWYIDQRSGIIPIMILLHLLAFVHGIFYIMLGSWKAFSQCIGGTVVCNNVDIVVYTIGIMLALVMSIGGFLTFISVSLYSSAYWKRQFYYSSNATAYADLVSDGVNPGPSASTVSVTSTTDNQDTDDDEEDRDKDSEIETTVATRSSHSISKRRGTKKEKKHKKAKSTYDEEGDS